METEKEVDQRLGELLYQIQHSTASTIIIVAHSHLFRAVGRRAVSVAAPNVTPPKRVPDASRPSTCAVLRTPKIARAQIFRRYLHPAVFHRHAKLAMRLQSQCAAS